MIEKLVPDTIKDVSGKLSINPPDFFSRLEVEFSSKKSPQSDAVKKFWTDLENPNSEVSGEGKSLNTEESKAQNQIDNCESKAGEKRGGRFGDVFKEGEGDTTEVHHMPADSTTDLSRNDGPAIKMEKLDHRQTASCGSSREAIEYRAEQERLIKEGKFRDALQMDIDDIREKFGSKYDDAIDEMLEYVDKLEQEGKI